MNFFDQEDLRLVLVGGKGGVGKTAVAGALSLHLAERFPARSHLLISTGPSHSLADLLEVPVGPEPRQVRGNLSAVELDAAGLFAQFKKEHGHSLRTILDRGTYLDDEDISRFLDLSFPGLDEMMAMLRMVDLLEAGSYDTLVVDTAPTGHTLRLLSLPGLTAAWVAVLDQMLEKHRFMSLVYTRQYRRDQADAFIDTLNRELARLAGALRSQAECRFVPVTLPEPVVIAETERLLDALEERQIAAGCLIVNDLWPARPGCELCWSRAVAQREALERLRARRPGLEMILLPNLGHEVRGEPGLRALIAGGHKPGHKPGTDGTFPISGNGCLAPVTPVPLPDPDPGVRLFLFCGKGGVGKSTLSTAFSLELARRSADRRVLLFSTDPAHSLSDCLAQPIGPEERPVRGAANLFAVELDPEALFREWKLSYRNDIEQDFEKFARRMAPAASFDQQVLSGLLDLTPPGLDELMCLSRLAELFERGRYDAYVLDTAPAGHTLRFLELFTEVRDWLRTFFAILLKYRNVVWLPAVSGMLIETSQRVARVHRILTDPAQCEAVLVTTPAKAAVAETGRLLAALDRIGIRRRMLLVNQVVGESRGCASCAAIARQHRVEAERCRQAYRELEVIELPRWAGELRGSAALANLFRLGRPAVERSDPALALRSAS